MTLFLGDSQHCKVMDLDAFFRGEVKPALGCTEPGAVALATSTAARHIGGTPERISLRLSANIYKNGVNVGVPKTNGLTGNNLAARAIKKLAKMILQAENPLIFTRYIGRNHVAVASLVELAELIGAPVFETPGYANFPTNNPLHMGPNMERYIPKSDLILVVDANGWPPWYPPNSITEKSSAKLVFVDLDPLQINYPVYGYPVDLLIAADSSLAIPALTEELKRTSLGEVVEGRSARWGVEHRHLREKWRKLALSEKNNCPISPRWLCYCIDEVVDENTIVVHETISHSTMIFEHIERHRVGPGTQLEASGPVAHTGLGQGLGVALGKHVVDQAND